jgi:hypothetical protein
MTTALSIAPTIKYKLLLASNTRRTRSYLAFSSEEVSECRSECSSECVHNTP